MLVYLAHPITGLGYYAVMDYYRETEAALREAGYQTLCPMRGKTHLRNEREFRPDGYQHPVSTNHAIIERDAWMVAKADIVLLDLTGSKSVSIGCMMELAWAYWQHKHTIVVLPQDNPHRHAFVLEAADIVFETQSEALTYLRIFAEQNSSQS